MRNLFQGRARRLLVAATTSSAALGAALALTLPARVTGFVPSGSSLDLGQRDVRVFNNFTDPEANDNAASDPQFPGAVGAPLAIWKACVEWQSELHGNGNGDPHQLGGLGSGGANFDPTWQGLASDVGDTNDNVFSELAGSNLGVLAFTETPTSNGWRIRFYADVTVWEDGPQPLGFLAGHTDLQGVATHEYGHALGLDHSLVVGSTMWSTIVADQSTAIRSLHADDVAGVQAIYGPKLATKPRISGYALAGSVLTLAGAHFAASGNEVWFTNGSPGADGTPLVVGGLDAQDNGTTLAVAIPAAALPGDVLVRVPGASGDALSNAFPFDPAAAPCPSPLVYGTPKTTSLGTLPELFVTGSPHASTQDLVIGTFGGLPDRHGILFSGTGQHSSPLSGGTLLVAGPHLRHGQFQFDFTGAVELPIAVEDALVGTTRCYQLWFHDPADPFGIGLSNAVQVTFCP
jgi:hypothetical protein